MKIFDKKISKILYKILKLKKNKNKLTKLFTMNM